MTQAPRNVVDLRTDNRIQELLETRETQSAIIRQAKLLKDAAETEIRNKLGNAEAAIVNGWIVTQKTVSRKEFTVAASSYQKLDAKRIADPT